MGAVRHEHPSVHFQHRRTGTVEEVQPETIPDEICSSQSLGLGPGLARYERILDALPGIARSRLPAERSGKSVPYRSRLMKMYPLRQTYLAIYEDSPWGSDLRGVRLLESFEDLSDGEWDAYGSKALSGHEKRPHRHVSTASEILGALRDPHSFRPSSAVGRMTQSFWSRLTRTASRGAQRRFIETFELFFRAVTQQARDRESGDIPDLESYIAMRRDTSGCKPCWALIEYAYDLDLPDWVMEDPTIRGLEEAANDLVTWSNDIFSFNREQACGDTHNMIVVVQTQQKLDLQSAIDYVGELCMGCVDRFQTLREQLPSWGPEIDAQVQVYVEGLGDWMIGNLVWSFETERYFGKAGPDVRKALSVALLPRRK
ncbi:hypothetical protein NUW54_g5554 [Trametes sanguinea]|uniref:Uncharacterized protein n=1 Tax=Trametes sanguinea TaxID=158606 RepID=A0ACC1PUT1_9APHY|nr:hypothetical protein NUW54_g5554 [Trametes sanguinea]